MRFGIGESDLEQMLPDLIERGRQPTVGITVSQATITLRISAEGSSTEACREMMQETIHTIHDCLGDLVFAEGDRELQHVIPDLLKQHSLTLSVVECGTTGLVTNWLAELPVDCSSYRGGIVIPAPTLLSQLWSDLELTSLSSQGGKELLQTVAEVARCQLPTDIILVLGPEPSNDLWTHTDDRIHYALAMNGQIHSQSAPYTGHPAILRARSAKQALNHLRLKLLQLPEKAPR